MTLQALPKQINPSMATSSGFVPHRPHEWNALQLFHPACNQKTGQVIRMMPDALEKLKEEAPKPTSRDSNK